MEKKKIRTKIQIESLHAILKEGNGSCVKEILLLITKSHCFPLWDLAVLFQLLRGAVSCLGVKAALYCRTY